MLLKRLLKRSAQAMVAAGAPRLWSALARSLVVLTYHRVLPRGDARLLTEQPGMWVHPETLRLHLRLLKRHFEMVRLSEWLGRARRGETLPPRACAITFDDGWRDNHEHAFPLLREEQVPATLFLCSDMVGAGGTFWPEKLAALLRFLAQPGREAARARQAWLKPLCPGIDGAGRLDVAAIDAAIVVAKQRYRDQELSRRLDEAIADSGMTAGGIARALLDWGEVGEMRASGLVEVGSHTRRHTRMSDAMSDEVLHDEIVGSKRALEEKTGAEIELFCYPNGDVTRRAYALVKAAYRGACSTRRGWHASDADPFVIRRIGMHEGCAHDRAAFIARISGIF